MSDRRGSDSARSGPLVARYRTAIPVALMLLVLVYEFLWRGRVAEAGSWSERIINLALFLLVGPVMAWWGQSMARSLLQRLARSEAASEEKSRLLEQRNRQLQTVIQASRAMTAVLDLPQVAAMVVEQVVAYTRFTKASLVLGPNGHGDYVMAGSHGLSREYLVQFMDALKGPQKAASPVEWCRLTLQPVVVEKLSKDFRTAGLRDVYAMAGVESMIAVPLLCREEFRGVLVVYLEQGGQISTPEISLVTALASQAALAVENARLYTMTVDDRARHDAALECLESVASAMARTRTGFSPLLHQVAQATAKLFAPARVRVAVSKAGRPSPLVITEAHDLQPDEPAHLALTLPVTLDGEEFGQMEVFLSGEGRSLLADEVRSVRAFVHLIASALGNAVLAADARQAVESVEQAYMGTLEALTKALEMRDHETEGHSRRVVQYTLSLAQKLGVPEEDLVPIMRGALLHDIGKIGIPDCILRKQGPLTDEEWVTMKEHPRIGYRMLHGIEFLKSATPIILHHHEQYDGQGYPEGLKGEQIPLGARIFAVADAYDAMTSNRPYRRGRTHEEALAEIRAGADTQFDGRVVEALMSLPFEELSRIRGQGTEIPATLPGR